MQSQMLDSQIEKLTSERDSKYEALQKCEKKTKGFKIAGITTLVATGFGIYGNIKLSEKIKGKNFNGSNSGGGAASLDMSDRDYVIAYCQEICEQDRAVAMKAEWPCDDCVGECNRYTEEEIKQIVTTTK